MVSFIYAKNYSLAISLWDPLRIVAMISPWGLLEEFNTGTSTTKRMGGDIVWDSEMYEFNSFLVDLGL